MVKTAGVDGDMVPVVNRVEAALAAQVILGRVRALVRERSGWRRPALEQVIEDVDAIRDVDMARVVGVGPVETGERRPAEEKGSKDLDGVADVDLPVAVGIAPDEVCRPESRSLAHGGIDKKNSSESKVGPWHMLLKLPGRSGPRLEPLVYAPGL